MIIKATSKLKSILDLSSRERLQESNLYESKHFRLTLKPNQIVEVDDQWYSLQSIQSAVKDGYIEIFGFKKQETSSDEILDESSITEKGFNLVEILNRPYFPIEQFRKINENMNLIDSLIGEGGSSIDTPSSSIIDNIVLLQMKAEIQLKIAVLTYLI